MGTILLCALPNIVQRFVQDAVATEADLTVAASCDEDGLDVALDRTGANVLIVEERGDRREAFYRGVLLTHPSLNVVMLSPGGRNATLISLKRVRIADASPRSLIHAVRSELSHEVASGD